MRREILCDNPIGQGSNPTAKLFNAHHAETCPLKYSTSRYVIQIESGLKVYQVLFHSRSTPFYDNLKKSVF